MRPMRVQDLSPGWQTEFILHRLDAHIDEQPEGIAVCTDADPSFYWGNCLIVPHAPADADLPHWLARFEQRVAAGRPGVRHVAIGVDAPRNGLTLPAWLAAGFQIDDTTVLSLAPGGLLPAPRSVRAPSWQLRTIDWAHDLPAFVDQQSLDSTPYEPAAYRLFRQRQMARHAALAQQGLGQWFGLWCGDALAASCGLMRDAARPGALGRFQHVSTHPQWRRRGLCTALIHGVSAWGFAHWQLAQAMLCADPHDVAIGIYRSLGYQPVGSSFNLQRNAPHDRQP